MGLNLPPNSRSYFPGRQCTPPTRSPPHKCHLLPIWGFQCHVGFRLPYLATLRFQIHLIFQYQLPSCQILEALTPDNQYIMVNKYRSSWLDITQGLASSRIQMEKTAWAKWHEFTDWIGVYSDISNFSTSSQLYKYTSTESALAS